jgi:hypothetical protein
MFKPRNVYHPGVNFRAFLADRSILMFDSIHLGWAVDIMVKRWNKGCFSFDARLLLLKHVVSAMAVF